MTDMSKIEFYKPYFDKGHILTSAIGKCQRCGAYVIDLAEDQMYGDMRECFDRPTQPQEA